MASSFKANTVKATGGAGLAIAFVACCMTFIGPHEGTIFKAYPDSGNVWTICKGHTKNVREGDTATPEQCELFLEQDTREAIVWVNILTEGHHIPDAAKKVFVDQVFNAGPTGFAHSTMLRKIKADDLAGACREFPRWHFVDGKDCTIRANNCYGIVTRRAEQMAECLKGLTP